jgi:Phage integrase family
MPAEHEAAGSIPARRTTSLPSVRERAFGTHLSVVRQYPRAGLYVARHGVYRSYFLPWCEEHGITGIEQIDRRILNRWSAWFSEGRAPSSVHSYSRTVNSFLSWADDLLEQGGHHSIRVIGKGSKLREVPVLPALYRDLRKFCRGRSGPVWMSLHKSPRTGEHEQPTRSGLLQLVKSAADRAGVPEERAYPHAFRHYFVTRCLRKGMNIELLRRIVGHRDTTLISRTYGHLITADLSDAPAEIERDN